MPLMIAERFHLSIWVAQQSPVKDFQAKKRYCPTAGLEKSLVDTSRPRAWNNTGKYPILEKSPRKTFEKSLMSTRHTNPYHIKNIERTNGISVWLVDGERIRKDLNENFVQSDHHGRFPFIPTDEFWIDADTDFREHRFFVDRFLAERALVENGTKPEKAEKIGETIERREREDALPKKTLRLKETRETLIGRIQRKRFEPYSSDALAIWIVYGKLVRDLLFLNYDAGGHDRVYPWIPDREIWIEEALPEQERGFILLHELHERFLMGTGKKYPEAHHGATIVEDRFRNAPKGLEMRIQEELEKNKNGGALVSR